MGSVIGDGAVGGGSGRPDGDLGADAALARKRVLRPAAGAASGGAGLDAFVEGLCRPYYAPRMGAPSLPPGRYFRMHMIGYFEGIDSERGIAWRCADSFSLRDFLRLSNCNKTLDHSWLSRTLLSATREALWVGADNSADQLRPVIPSGKSRAQRAAAGLDTRITSVLARNGSRGCG